MLLTIVQDVQLLPPVNVSDSHSVNHFIAFSYLHISLSL